MKEISYVITDELGLHARPAGMLAKKVKEYDAKITLKKGEKKCPAKNIMGIMGLAVKKGDTIVLEIEGEQEETAAAELAQFLAENA